MTVTVSTGGVTFATRQTVALDFTGSTAGADDYLVVPANILLAAGATLGTATITVVNDRVVETRETIVVSAGHDSAPLGSATISIPPNDQPDFGLEVSSDTIAEGESVVVTVTTGGVTFADDQTIELDLGGSVTAGSDYTVTPSAITLRAGATAGSATIRAVDDSEVEERETITIAATHDGTAIAAAAAVTISAGDRTAFRLTVDPAAAIIAEGESAVLTVTTGGVTFAEEQTIELDLGGSATAGSDYTIMPSAITIAAGAMAGSATITAVDDSAAEDSETIVDCGHSWRHPGRDQEHHHRRQRPPAVPPDRGPGHRDSGGRADGDHGRRHVHGGADHRARARRQRDGGQRLHDHAVRHHHRRRRDGRQRHHHGGRRQ